MLGLRSVRFLSAARRAHTSVARTFTENNPATFPSVKDTMLKPNFHEYQHAHGLLAIGYVAIPPELEHLEHLLAHPREFETLPYMRKRKNSYPWGDNSAFHHPHANPAPSE
ncbi:UNVERIFIED_CONTAM: hypothetical protein HDU68_010627 [Siphonaria sp. JEL0065]|nr:hypothetical protein HDU68_010627 [Siphonaria sp. JEL0065]